MTPRMMMLFRFELLEKPDPTRSVVQRAPYTDRSRRNFSNKRNFWVTSNSEKLEVKNNCHPSVIH